MIRRVFWGWDRPVIDQALDLLTQDWQGGELDLANTLIIGPSAESGRRLKEALARATASRGGAVSVPHVWAPERALLTHEDRAVAATDTQSLLAWIRVMLDADLVGLSHLFPVPPADRGWTWATEMARALMEVATAVGAGGYGFAEVAALDDLPCDRDRWQDLAALEQAYLAVLSELGVEDLQWLKRQRAATPQFPEGVQRILVLPAPDLPVLFRRWLEAASQRIETTLYIQAPASISDRFDTFGGPLKTFWGEQADVLLPLSETQIHLEHDPAGQARRVLDLTRELAPRQRVALGVCDPEVTAHLENRLIQEGVRIYEPGGVPADRHGTVQMLSLWARLITTDDWQAFAALLRVPDVRDMLGHCSGASGMNLVAEADKFASERLPVTLAHAQELLAAHLQAGLGHRGKGPGVEKLQMAMVEARRLAGEFSRQSLHEAARTLLIQLFGERSYEAESPGHRDHVKLCTDWLQLCQELHTESTNLRLKTSAASLLSLSIERLKQQRLADPRGEIDLVLMGWLELLWEPAPALILSGFNEERVPGILISHPFLPDQLREGLGLASQASRFARDAYLLQALAEQRLSTGSLHLTCGLWSEGKDTLRPSRLLFLCADKALPQRVRHLFPKDFESTLPKELPRQRAWKLQPHAVVREPLARISASRLGAYLRCPFTYYLDHVLGMSTLDAGKRELDPMEYGSLIHVALTALQGETSCDEASLGRILVQAVEKRASQIYGLRLPVPVEVQLDAASQRLRAAAGIEVNLRKEGWVIRQTEQTFGDGTDDRALKIEGARFGGRIDRIDRHPDGITRIIDYKTGDRSLTPFAAHLKVLTKRMKVAPEDEWKTFTASDGTHCLWQDLQLPLYAKAWSLHEPGPVQTAYWNLPKTVDGATLEIFDELDDTMIGAAIECAQEAVRRINAGIFWPPAKGSKFDQYEGLIHGAVSDAIEWKVLEGEAPA